MNPKEGVSLKFFEGYQGWYTPEENKSAQLKHCDNNRKDKDISLTENNS